MNPTRWSRRISAPAVLAVAVAACSGRDTGTLPEAPVSTDPVIFTDDFNGVDFQFFAGATLDVMFLDTSESHMGTASLRVVIPDWPQWTGGAFPSGFYRDLSGYNALTFWAKASDSTSFDVAGLGNDNTGTSQYTAEWRNISLTTEWKKYIIPIPLPAKLSLERGMFFFADAVPENDPGIEVWFDDILFENVIAITDPRPSMATRQIDALAGTTWNVSEIQTTFLVEGVDQIIGHLPGYFDFASSEPQVATVTNGVITVVGPGTAEITATFGGMPVAGTVTVNSELPDATSPAPAPTLPPERVVSIFSNAYSNVPVDRWSTDWDYADVSDLKIQGDDTKLYELQGFSWNGAAIEYVTETIDAATMTHVHLDAWSTDGTQFKLKLVDFGPDGAYGGDDDSEHEVVRAIATNEWVGVEIPLAEFTGLAERAHLAQMIFSGIDLTKVYVDNIYFHD